MVKLNKIYTKTGDDGTTGLVRGPRRLKYDLRINCFGTVDEANCLLGIVRLELLPALIANELPRIQNDLFDLGSDLACPPGMAHEDKIPRISPAQVARLDAALLAANAELPPLKSFVLPAGGRATTWLHVARTVTRRAERDLCAAMAVMPERPFNPELLRYLNRLSDLLFVWSRLAADGQEVAWVPGAQR